MSSNSSSYRPHVISIVVAVALVRIQFAPVVGNRVHRYQIRTGNVFSYVRFGWPLVHHTVLTVREEAANTSVFHEDSRPIADRLKWDVIVCATLVSTCMIAAERWARRRTKHIFALGSLFWIVTTVGITLGLVQLEGAALGEGYIRQFWNAVMLLPLDDQHLTIWGRYPWHLAVPLILIWGVAVHTFGWVMYVGCHRFLQLVLPRLFPTPTRSDIGLVELSRK